MKVVVAIIPVYDGMPEVKRCIESLEQSEYPIKIILVDNGGLSQESFHDYLKSKSNNSIYLVQNSENIGFGKACNIGIQKGFDLEADFFFFLNQDAYIFPNTIGVVVDHAEKNNSYGIISPLQCKSEKSLDDKFSSYVAKKTDLLSDALFDTPKTLYNTGFVNAAAWMISRETINTVGGFDPLFFMYGEDQDYCRRMVFHGLKIGVCTDSIVIHTRQSKARSATFYERTEFLSYKIFASITMSARNYSRPFIRNVLGIIPCIASFLFPAVLALDLVLFFAVAKSLLRYLQSLPTQISHFEQCKEVGAFL